MTSTGVEDDTQKPGILARSYASAQLVWRLKHYIPTVATTAVRYYASSYHESWPLGVALFVALARYSSETSRAQRALNPNKDIDVVEETQKNRKKIEGMLVSGKLPKNGAIREIEFKVRQRGLGGVLEEADKEEVNGERVIKAEWSAHDSIFTTNNSTVTDRVILYLHGGAYCFLSPKTHRPLCLQLSRELNCRVLSVDYRLSPETKFPGALHDAVSAYFYLTDELKIPACQILVGGDSAGGNLATALLLYLRDSSLPSPAGGILLSPWVDFTTSFSSWDSNASTDYLAIDKNDPLVPQPLFVRSEEDLIHSYVSPSFSGSLEGLPPLIVLAGGGETLRDEITLFAQRADKDGVDVTHEVFDGGVHVFVAVMEKGMGKKGIENIGEWARKEERFEGVKKVESEGWKQVVKDLEEAYEKKQATLPPKPKKEGEDAREQAQERFVWEESIEDAPLVKLRGDAHPLAIKVIEENSRQPHRKGLTKIVRAKRNPKFNGGLLSRLHL